MNKIAIAVVAIAAFAVTTSLLAQVPAARSPKAGAVPATPNMDMKSPIGQMDAQMKKLQAQHARMMSARTPEERQKWMDEQHKSMQEGMAMMSRMMLDVRMGGGMMGRQGSSADADGSMQMMKKGIEMMQLMTQLMMDQLGMTRPANGVGTAPKN